MIEREIKATRDIARQQSSTIGRHSGARTRVGQTLGVLDDPREQRFVERYVETNHGTQSAIVAGYSVKSARTIASQLLKRRNIREAIDRRNAELMDELDFKPARIIRELAKIAGANSADFLSVDGEGNPRIDFSRVTRRHLAAVASVENTEKGVKYRTHDKIRALVELAKIARMYPADRTEITGIGGGPIEHTNTINIEVLEPDKREQLRQVLLAIRAKHIEAEARAS
jgi:phage terminase small subunit